jgi:integrase
MAEIHRLSVGTDGRVMVSVYLREHATGNCYYARYKISNKKLSGNQRYVTESLKTEDLRYAIEKARTRYAEITVLETQGKAIKSDTVAQEIDRFFAEYLAGVQNKISMYSPNVLQHYKKGLVRLWKSYVGQIPLKNINHDHMAGYESWRQNFFKQKIEQGKTLHGNSKEKASARTIELEVNQFKAFLRWASSRGKYTGSALDFTYKTDGTTNKRSAFTTSQWTKLTGFMRRNAFLEVGLRGNDSRLIRHRHMLKAYVLFMKNTGLRPGEARNLRWSDVEFRDSDQEEKRLVRITVLKGHSKVKKSSVVIGNEGAFNAISDWLNYRKKIENFTSSSDLIWCDNDGVLIKDFREGFNTLIKSAGVDLDAAGNKLTIYSLRHTYITEQLKAGVAIYSIASNCNTSVAMIETYYSDARSKDFEDALTSGYRRQSSQRSSEKITEKNSSTVTLDLAAEPTKTQSKRKPAAVDSDIAKPAKKLGKAAPLKS